jgi:hypothetical protein
MAATPHLEIVSYRSYGCVLMHQVVDTSIEKDFVEKELPTRFSNIKEFKEFVRGFKNVQILPCRYSYMVKAAVDKGIDVTSLETNYRISPDDGFDREIYEIFASTDKKAWELLNGVDEFTALVNGDKYVFKFYGPSLFRHIKEIVEGEHECIFEASLVK